MSALFFPNLDALRLAIASGLVPPAIAQAPARVGSDAGGHLWLETEDPLPRESLAALGRFGLRVLSSSTVPTHPVSCWAEVLPLRRTETPRPGVTLFDLPDRRLATFVARLLRVQNAPFGLRLLPEPNSGRSWVTTHAPPTPVLYLDDPDADVHAYFEQRANVWVARGWEHPLVEHLVVPPGCVLLCDPTRGVVRVEGESPFPRHDELPLQPREVSRPPSPAPPRIEVRFRLKRHDGAGEETLWVLTPTELEQFRAFCQGADERLLRRFELASVTVGGVARHLVRRANGEDRIAHLPSLTGSFQPDPRLPWLFVPLGFALRPVIRLHELARECARGEDQIVWVEAAADGVAIHAVAQAAFRPLWEQVEYAVPMSNSLTAESQSDELFAFDRFAIQVETSIDLELEEAPRELAELEPAEDDAGWLSKSVSRLTRWMRGAREREGWDRPQDDVPESPPGDEQVRPPAPQIGRVERTLASADALLHGHDWPARRRELETRLLADYPRLGLDERAGRWAELASVYAATGQSQDAAVCWTNAMWDCASPPQGWLEQWAVAECRAAKRSDRVGDLERWLGEPGRPGTGRVVASLAALHGFRPNPAPEFVAALPRVLAILDQQFDDIPIRAAWLARLAVARSCDGDALGVARWRDRLLRRLHERGPGLDLDEPSFLRFRGRAAAERFKVAREWLLRMKGPVREWAEKPTGFAGLQAFGLASETGATGSYGQMMFAWGLGILGERAVSRDWSARARKELARATGPRADPAGHAILGDLFLHRIKEAHEGHAPKPVLPAELQHRLEKLPEFARYSVDRLREHCRILQPAGPVRANRGRDLRPFWGHDRLGDRLSLFASRTDPAQLSEEAMALLADASERPATTNVPRIVFALLEASPQLDSVHLDSLLEMVPAALDWMEVWVQAGRWTDEERAERVSRFQARMLESAFAVAPDSAAERLMRHLTRAVSAGSMHSAVVAAAPRIFRTAKRFELIAAADALIQALDPVRAEGAKTLTTDRVGLAVGWLVAGNEEVGNQILDAARDSLFIAPAANVQQRTALALAYAEALGFAPTSIALGRLEEIFQRLDRVTVHCSSNCYFTLQPLRLIDTVVRSVVTDDFTLGPTVRAWLDEDEFFIRRRIHRDMAALLREGEGA